MSLVSKLLKPIAGAVTLAAIAVSVPTQAQAFTVSFTGGLTSPVAGATTVDFDDIPTGSVSSFTSGAATYSGTGRIVQGSEANRFRDPSGDGTNYLTMGAPQEPGPVTISFADPLKYFGLYWGSIDTYNSIAFFQGDTLVKGFGSGTGFTSIADLFAGQGIIYGDTSQYVNFFADNASEVFDRVVLASSQPAFESDNHAFQAVPTPALVPAALGFGAAMMRKRKKAEKDAAEANA